MNLTPGAWRYVLPPLALGIPLLALVFPIGLALVGMSAFAAWFFRDPERSPAGEGIVSPADGRVSVLREDGDRVRVGVFMSPFDVHVNRAPAGGEVTRLDHRGAAHRPAFSKESARNERVEFSVGDVDGALIAGWFARRITPSVSRGDEVTRGERIGHIAFGSRADVVLPPEYGTSDVRVRKGEKVRAGESIVARRD
ncbi:protein sorting system archaetidylserine decarboxylase [Halorarum halobium]|uniref:protein sorting system archaetidylserine decarboxylase n=1 Tax=Halorarum halobium TaxID=3075121 RepID=UPI0028A6AE05|nr:protein sorting system archaetidylserine decarboxylase [Halobaculum sp. XH14]